jgi:hypothetical protein
MLLSAPIQLLTTYPSLEQQNIYFPVQGYPVPPLVNGGQGTTRAYRNMLSRWDDRNQ